MKGKTGDASLLHTVLHRYQRWSSQVFLYSTTVILATSTAIVLDLRFHWSPERVLLYVLPLTVILLLVVPSLTVLLKRIDWKGEPDLKPRQHDRVSRTVLDNWTSMVNPARALAEQFVRRSPTTLLVLGVTISAIDFTALYAASAKEGVLHISQGVGLLNNYGLLSTIVGNPVLVYLAKKYYESVCSIRTSKAIVNREPIGKSLALLTDMIKLRQRYRFLIYLFMTMGGLFWLSNVGIHIAGNPEIRWGQKVFDSLDHPLTFFFSRFHNFYTWLVIMPFVGYVVTCSSLQLKRTIAIASRGGALTYDLLNPDRRGGFAFLRKAQFSFSVITGLLYIQILLNSFTFQKVGLERVITYIILTILVICINAGVFADIYAVAKKLRFESLDKIKENVYKNDKLSFEILKYCYERRINWYLVLGILIQAAGIIVTGIGLVSENIYRISR